jgi:Cu+-exporting ATPase
MFLVRVLTRKDMLKRVRQQQQNFIYAFLFNCLGLPFAAIGLLSPVLASLAMAISSMIVVGNSMRLKNVATRKLFA